MSDYPGLHSHSGLERELSMKPNKVLVDARFAPMFSVEATGKTIVRNNIKYIEINTIAFIGKGGEFKHFNE